MSDTGPFLRESIVINDNTISSMAEDELEDLIARLNAEYVRRMEEKREALER